MIAKVTRGRGFKGLMSYLMTGSDGRQADRVEWTSGRHLFTLDTDLVPAVMHSTAGESEQVERPVYHLAISLHPSERLDREALERVVDRTLADLGLEGHQAFLVAHNDAGHQHVHVMINRVHPDTGKAWRPSHDYARIEKSLRHQERELGLIEVKGRHFAIDGQSRYQGADLSSGDQRFSQRMGVSSFGENVRAVARRDMLEAGSWAQLHERLGEVGLRIEKRGRGIVLTDGDLKVKASVVDRKASLACLERRLGPYEPIGKKFPAGKSERWQEVRALRTTVEELANRREASRSEGAERWNEQVAERQAARLGSRREAASRAFDDQLGRVFSDPAKARRTFDAEVGKRGPEKAATSLAREPERFGRLRGRGGPFSSAERWAAIDAAPHAAAAAREFLEARATSKIFRGKNERRTASDRKAPRTRSDRRRSTEQHLKRTATRLVKRLGWTLAAKALTAPQYQLLKMTLRVGRVAMDAALEVQRGAER